MVTPSTTETFGNVVLEAMASGLSVVSADAPSARALITPGENGFLCPPDRKEAYVEVVEKLIASPGLRAKIGGAARNISLTHSWEDVSSTVERAYLHLQKQHRLQLPPLGGRAARRLSTRLTARDDAALPPRSSLSNTPSGKRADW